MDAINLGGHSGCRVQLIESNGENYVRKISSNAEYNERLKKQCKKQADFVSRAIHTPEVYASGYDADGMFYFDMEYVRGITLAEYMKTIEIGKIAALIDVIVCGLIDMSEGGLKLDRSNTKTFERKVDNLAKKLSNRGNPTVNRAMVMLSNHDWRRFCVSSCHGDLTMENIIVKNDEIYLIDFLDSFYGSSSRCGENRGKSA